MHILQIGEAPEQYESFLEDESGLSGCAAFLCIPKDCEDFCACVQHFHKQGIPVTVQGARTGIVGAAVPRGGAVISTERMQHITGLRRSDDGFLLCAEAGVHLSDLTKCLENRRFDTTGWSQASLDALSHMAAGGPWEFVPRPTEDSATIGGMFACNAAGCNADRVGRTGSYVQSVRWVPDTGVPFLLERGAYRIEESGCRLPWGAELQPCRQIHALTGFLPEPDMDVIDFLAGSEGMFGAALELTLRIQPAPAVRWYIVAFFQAEEAAAQFCDALSDMPFSGCSLQSMEYFDRRALTLFIGGQQSGGTRIPDGSLAAVCFEITGSNPDAAEEQLSVILEMLAEYGADPDAAWAANLPEEISRIRAMRHQIPQTINELRKKSCFAGNYKLATDFSIPGLPFSEMLAIYRQDLKSCGVESVVFGHMPNNHLHINFLPRTQEEAAAARACMRQWAAFTVRHGGCIAAENGIGKLKPYLFEDLLGQEEWASFRLLKQAMDPDDFWNPGNWLRE